MSVSQALNLNCQKVSDQVTGLVDNGCSLDIVYLDLTKAFDKVLQQNKLNVYAVFGKLHAWIADWLVGRRQPVCVQGECSQWRWVLSGVPPTGLSFGAYAVSDFLGDHSLCCLTVVCLSVLSVTLVYCGQTVGWIKMKLSMQVGLGPSHIVLDRDPGPPSPNGHSPPIFGPYLL